MGEIVVKFHIEPLQEGGYLATSDAFPGLVAQGRTMAETMEIAQDVARKLIESYKDHGDPFPPEFEQLQNQDMDMVIPVGLP